jgi:hypothetical protein
MKTHSHIRLILSLLIPLLSLPLSGRGDALHLFNSGTDAAGNVLPVGAADPRITIVERTDGIVGTLAYVVDPGGTWMTNNSTSGWLSARPNPFDAVNAQWTYRVPIDLTGCDPSTASINVGVASDNEILWTRLNGLDLSFSTPGNLASWDYLSLTNGFTNGINYLDFRLNDWGVVSGFRVELAGTATPLPTLSIRVSQVELCWDTILNRTYQLQYRSDLTANIWTDLGTQISGTGARVCVQDPVPVGQPQRFYRVVLQ